MNLGSFMDPEYPIFSTTLCYLEREDTYLMLHRVKKQDDYNHDKWVGVGGKFERFESPEGKMIKGDACKEGVLEWVPKEKVTSLPIWEGDKIFFRLLKEERPYFSLKLVYEGDTLKQAVLDGKAL